MIDGEFIHAVLESFVEKNIQEKAHNEFSLTESGILENSLYGLNTYNPDGNFNIDEEEYKNFLIDIM